MLHKIFLILKQINNKMVNLKSKLMIVYVEVIVICFYTKWLKINKIIKKQLILNKCQNKKKKNVKILILFQRFLIIDIKS
jgi:hypothetical protein